MYVLLTGAISNAGDFLTKEKNIKLLKFFKPKRKILKIDRQEKYTEKMKKHREFSHSLFVVKDMKTGEVFTEKNIRSIRPEYGLPPIVLPGGSIATWLVSPKFRGKGLGYRLIKEVESEFNVLVSLGSNLKTSVPIYLKNNFSLLRVLNRYVIPLDIKGYVKLLNFKLSMRRKKMSQMD